MIYMFKYLNIIKIANKTKYVFKNHLNNITYIIKLCLIWLISDTNFLITDSDQRFLSRAS